MAEVTGRGKKGKSIKKGISLKWIKGEEYRKSISLKRIKGEVVCAKYAITPFSW